MAEIFLARSTSEAGVERYLVLKRVLTERSRDPQFARMFLDEARLAAQLQHPNIAQVLDIGKLAGSYFFTMEYVHGEDLRAMLHNLALARRPFPLNHALHVATGALAALHHAHERTSADDKPLGIVHRDVSPSNVMVSYEGIVKLLDFGVAKASERATESRSGTIKGKIAYLSPEQCRGQSLDRRSDIYSLGIVLYEMLTGRRLYKRETDFATMSAIVGEDVAPPSTGRAEVSPELDRIVMRALDKDPERRYATAADMLEELETLATAEHHPLSATAMGRFLRELFGERPKPWVELQSRADGSSPVAVTGESAVEIRALADGVPDPIHATGSDLVAAEALEEQLHRAPALWHGAITELSSGPRAVSPPKVAPLDAAPGVTPRAQTPTPSAPISRPPAATPAAPMPRTPSAPIARPPAATPAPVLRTPSAPIARPRTPSGPIARPAAATPLGPPLTRDLSAPRLAAASQPPSDRVARPSQPPPLPVPGEYPITLPPDDAPPTHERAATVPDEPLTYPIAPPPEEPTYPIASPEMLAARQSVALPPAPARWRRGVVIAITAGAALGIFVVAYALSRRGEPAPASVETTHVRAPETPAQVPAAGEPAPHAETTTAGSAHADPAADAPVDAPPAIAPSHAAIEPISNAAPPALGDLIARSSWTDALALCQDRAFKPTGDDRQSCGIAACNAKKRPAALAFYQAATKPQQAAIERACRDHGVVLVAPVRPHPPTPTPTPAPSPSPAREDCEANPLRCQQ